MDNERSGAKSTVAIIVAIITSIAAIIGPVWAARISNEKGQAEAIEAMAPTVEAEYLKGFTDGIAKADKDNAQKLVDEYNRGYSAGYTDGNMGVAANPGSDGTTRAPQNPRRPASLFENVIPTGFRVYQGNQGDSRIEKIGDKKDLYQRTNDNGLWIWLARWNGSSEKSASNSDAPEE